MPADFSERILSLDIASQEFDNPRLPEMTWSKQVRQRAVPAAAGQPTVGVPVVPAAPARC